MTDWIYGFIAGGCFFNILALVVRRLRQEAAPTGGARRPRRSERRDRQAENRNGRAPDGG